jgi:hypothetical protein
MASGPTFGLLLGVNGISTARHPRSAAISAHPAQNPGTTTAVVKVDQVVG